MTVETHFDCRAFRATLPNIALRDLDHRAAALPFAKYEGLGNDFIVLEEADCPLEACTPALARALCDRHTGIGADGVLWLGRDANDREIRLVILNADGSRPEMCGNGVRCVAAFLHDAGKLALGAGLMVRTDAGPRPATVHARAHGTLDVEVDMGPVRASRDVLELSVGDCTVRVVPADAGNPHAVVFDPPESEHEMDLVRAVVARTDVFPNGANVEFVQREGDGFRVRVFERGVGWTRACGTGACAVAAAALSREIPPAREGIPVAITLEGGALLVTLRREGESFRTLMRGPARRVFTGSWFGGAA